MNAQRFTVRRILAPFAVMALAGAIGLTFSSPASAATSAAFVSSTSASYTDSASPTKSFGTKAGPYWVGAWQSTDGVSHESKAYFTFDLSSYKGATIDTAALVMDENSVNDCTATRQIALWQTDTPATKITWNNAPAETKKVFSGKNSYQGCPAGYLEFDAKTLITQDLNGTGIVTIEVSIPPAFAGDPSHGRSLSALSVELTYDHAPDAPTNLSINGVDCGSKQIMINNLQPVVHANLTDPDVNETGGGDGPMSTTLQVWPVGDPTNIQTYTENTGQYTPVYAWAYILAGYLTDGGSYVMRMQSNDGQLNSKWSTNCRFGVDVTGPVSAPTVTSADYSEGYFTPSGGTNVPGTFTFSANGDKSVVGFSYGEYDEQLYAAANKPGGTAVVTITPTSAGPYPLIVAGVDKAQNHSPIAEYDFDVKDNSPFIADSNPNGAFRADRTLTFTPNQAGTVTGYIYNFNNQGDQFVSAAADGSAQVTVTPDQVDEQNTVIVQSQNSDYLLSGQATYAMFFTTNPIVTSVQYPEGPWSGGIGVKGTFTFAPAYAGIVSYTYSFDGATPKTIAANAKGKATVHWTPTTSGSHELSVTSLDNTGLVSDSTYYAIAVNSNQPTVTSDVYQNYQPAGAPGQAGVFTFTSHQTGATTFVYQFGDAPAQTVAVGADGTAVVTWTPTSGTNTYLTVSTTDGSGTSSDPTTFGIYVTPYAPIITQANSAGTYTFTVTSELPGSTSFVWTLDSGDPQTVPVGPDGTATVTVTPEVGNSHFFSAYTTASGGLSSGTSSYYFYVSG